MTNTATHADLLEAAKQAFNLSGKFGMSTLAGGINCSLRNTNSLLFAAAMLRAEQARAKVRPSVIRSANDAIARLSA